MAEKKHNESVTLLFEVSIIIMVLGILGIAAYLFINITSGFQFLDDGSVKTGVLRLVLVFLLYKKTQKIAVNEQKQQSGLR